MNHTLRTIIRAASALAFVYLLSFVLLGAGA